MIINGYYRTWKGNHAYEEKKNNYKFLINSSIDNIKHYAGASATGTYGTMPWSASAKCSSNMFTAKLVTNYYCNSVKVTTTVTYTMGSNRAQTVNMSSGICTQTATTDVYGKRISVAGYTVNSMYSKNYIYGELCKTLTIV